jgi:hypothetical protein
MTRPARSVRSTIDRSKAVPSAPMILRSTQAVKSPLAAARMNQGTRGLMSRRQPRRPRCHQKTTRSAAGRVAVTVFVRRAITKSSEARA